MPMLTATPEDLPRPVAAALASPVPGEPGTLDAGGRTWTFLAWGRPTDPPLLLVHGVTSNAGIWWRIAPALAAAGRYVVAVDMPGHGVRNDWAGRYRFTETAEELAGFVRTTGLEVVHLAVVGHSWGGMVSAHLPGAGIRPAALVLLEPPVLTLKRLEALTQQPTEQIYATLEQSIAAVRAAYPGWSDGDVEAKARALIEFDPELVLSVLLKNGAWDGGMAALRQPKAAGINAWLIRGEWATGGFIPDSKVAAIEAQLGPNRVVTIAGGPHSPQRTHPEATILAILRALGG